MTDRERYHEAMRILLEGTTGASPKAVADAAGVSHLTVWRFLQGNDIRDTSEEAIAMFIWRKLNQNVLLSDADKEPAA